MLNRDDGYKYFDGDNLKVWPGGLLPLHPKTYTMEHSMYAVCDLYEWWREPYLVIVCVSARSDGKREMTHG